MADVVAGFAMRDGLVLLGKRKSGGKRGDLWECPGGKVEPGESHTTALCREWKEELGIDVGVGKFMAEAVLDVEVLFTVFLYEVTIPPNITPLNHDHDELRWVSLQHAIEYMPCSPAMYMHFPQVRRFLWDEYKRTP